MGKTTDKATGKANNSSAGKFFYSFGTVFLFAVLTICIINFSRDARVFQKTAAAVTTAETTTADSSSAVAGTINIDTSTPKAPSKSTGKQTKPSAPEKTQTDDSNTSGGAVQPGEEP